LSEIEKRYLKKVKSKKFIELGVFESIEAMLRLFSQPALLTRGFSIRILVFGYMKLDKLTLPQTLRM
jgi:hypothetical protein